jgi:Fur family transcriptional regulator, peroxide stress response regulator
MQKILDCSEYLRKNGIKPSFQRIKIFDYLVNNPVHPTVDTIYRSLVNEIPTLSKTTVYNTMSLFIEQGIVQLITIEDNEVRYDADTSVHGHFKCTACQKVLDFHVDAGDISYKGIENFDIIEQHIYLKGVCGTCKSANLQ